MVKIIAVTGATGAQGGGLVRAVLADPKGDELVVVEGGDLAKGTGLRKVFEEAENAAAIACYPDTARDLRALVGEVMAQHRIHIDAEASAYLVDHLGADRSLSRGELEKLALYAGDGGRIELEDAKLSVADSAALSLDDAVLAARSYRAGHDLDGLEPVGPVASDLGGDALGQDARHVPLLLPLPPMPRLPALRKHIT